MIEPQTGQFQMIDWKHVPTALAEGKIVMNGTEAEVRKVSNAIKAGNRELDKRSARRKAQKEARKRNR
jgi:hypothetical protein